MGILKRGRRGSLSIETERLLRCAIQIVYCQQLIAHFVGQGLSFEDALDVAYMTVKSPDSLKRLELHIETRLQDLCIQDIAHAVNRQNPIGKQICVNLVSAAIGAGSAPFVVAWIKALAAVY